MPTPAEQQLSEKLDLDLTHELYKLDVAVKCAWTAWYAADTLNLEASTAYDKAIRLALSKFNVQYFAITTEAKLELMQLRASTPKP